MAVVVSLMPQSVLGAEVWEACSHRHPVVTAHEQGDRAQTGNVLAPNG